MPQSQVQRDNQPNRGITLRSALGDLGRLASNLETTHWRSLRNSHRDDSVQRVARWHSVAIKASSRYNSVRRGHELWDLKQSLYHWLTHKHSVLKDALRRGEILQVDVLNAVLEIDVLTVEERLVTYLQEQQQLAQGSHPRTPSDGAASYRDEEQEEDRHELTKRHDTIEKALNTTERQLIDQATIADAFQLTTRICQLAASACVDQNISEACTRWHKEMIDMIERMCLHWTAIEHKSLISLLTRFEQVLEQLLNPPPAESAYHPAARQPADHAKVIKLFAECTGQLERNRDQD